MSERLKEVRATLEQARGALQNARKHINAFPPTDVGQLSDALLNLTDAVDVLTGEVEALTAWRPRVNDALTALKDFCQVVQKRFSRG